MAAEETHELTTIVDKSLENPINNNLGLTEKKRGGAGHDGSIEPVSNVSEAEGQVKVNFMA